MCTGRRVALLGLVVACGVVRAVDVPAEQAAVSRLWLELEPSRFAAQPTVTGLLYLQELAQALPVADKDATGRRAVHFSQAPNGWQREILVQVSRPAAFQPPELRDVVDLGGPGRLFWCAADAAAPQGILDMVGDLEQIWGGGMRQAVSDYAAAFDMLGKFRCAAGEVREEQGRLTGRLLLVAASEADAKRASGALALASTLGRMVSSAAVKTGGMTAPQAAALDAVLGSIETRLDGARLTVHLGIDVVTLRAALQ